MKEQWFWPYQRTVFDGNKCVRTKLEQIIVPLFISQETSWFGAIVPGQARLSRTPARARCMGVLGQSEKARVYPPVPGWKTSYVAYLRRYAPAR